MRFYRFALHKAYFDTGYSLTSYVKYIIALFGLSSMNVKLTLILGGVYAVMCYFLGLIWFKMGLVEADTEVRNQYNLFVKELRQKVKDRKI